MLFRSGLPESRHEGRRSGKGTLGKKAMICRDGHYFSQTHYTVLQSSTFVAPYIEVHKNSVRSKNPGKPDSWTRQKHMETFGSWLRLHLMNDTDVGDQHYLLAASPSSTVLTFQGYKINGNTFYTETQEKKSTNQNSGVRFDTMGQRTHIMVAYIRYGNLTMDLLLRSLCFSANGSTYQAGDDSQVQEITCSTFQLEKVVESPRS